MASHVKVLGWLNIVWGGMLAVAGLIVFLIMGGIAGFVGATASTDDRVAAVPIIGVIGGIIFVILVALSLPSIFGGYGLLQFKGWARILVIILSVFHLPGFPFGTALGIYGLWTLLNRETEALFQAPPVQYAPRPYGP